MRSIINVQGLRQVLRDPESGDEYSVFVDNLEIPAASFTAILGPSGCGKTTLLTVLGLLRAHIKDSALSRFEMWFDGDSKPTDFTPVWRNNLRTKANKIRRRHIGFALQSGELLPALTVAENIEIPLRINGASTRECRARVDELIQAFDLYRQKGSAAKAKAGSLARSRVNRLSGGEFQRVALARAIAHHPSLVFVDEPTASLNREMAHNALSQLRNLRQSGREQSTILMITHDRSLATEFCDYIIEMVPHKGTPSGGVKAFHTVDDFVAKNMETADSTVGGEDQ